MTITMTLMIFMQVLCLVGLHRKKKGGLVLSFLVDHGGGGAQKAPESLAATARAEMMTMMYR